MYELLGQPNTCPLYFKFFSPPQPQESIFIIIGIHNGSHLFAFFFCSIYLINWFYMFGIYPTLGMLVKWMQLKFECQSGIEWHWCSFGLKPSIEPKLEKDLSGKICGLGHWVKIVDVIPFFSSFWQIDVLVHFLVFNYFAV